MKRRLLLWTIGGAVVFGAAGAVIATSEPRRGEVFIAGDRPVTEDQVRQKLQSEGYLNIQIARQGGYSRRPAPRAGKPRESWLIRRPEGQRAIVKRTATISNSAKRCHTRVTNFGADRSEREQIAATQVST